MIIIIIKKYKKKNSLLLQTSHTYSKNPNRYKRKQNKIRKYWALSGIPKLGKILGTKGNPI